MFHLKYKENHSQKAVMIFSQAIAQALNVVEHQILTLAQGVAQLVQNHAQNKMEHVYPEQTV